jgi:hypothetical protein
MSDVERPSFPSPRQTPRVGPAAGAPVRNMADIAKLFLDGARPGNNGAPAPRRIGPGAMPIDAAPHPAAPAPAAKAPVRSALREEVPTPHEAPRQSVMMAVGLPASASSAAPWRLLSDAAAGLAAEQATTVAIIGMQPDRSGRPQVVLDVHGVESADDLPKMRPMAGVMDLQLAQTLFTLRPAIGLWLVAAPEPESPAFAAVAARLQEWLLVSPTDNEGIVAGYQHFKKSWVLAERRTDSPQRPARAPSVFLLAADESHAKLVHGRMRKAAQEFLKTDLKLAGIGTPGAGGEALRVLTLPASAGSVEALWTCILDELCLAGHHDAEHAAIDAHACDAHVPEPRDIASAARVPVTGELPIEDVLERISSTAQDVARHSAAAAGMVLDHLAQVLDPEERAALSASFDDPEPEAPAVSAAVEQPVAEAGPKFDIRTQVVPPMTVETPMMKPVPAAKPATARPAASAAPAPVVPTPPSVPAAPAGVTLRAFDVQDAQDETRTSQWDAVERSVRDLVPGSILLEARPPMSWATESCIAIDPDGRLHVWTLYKDGASWFALREWANEHRDLLALTRRDLVLSKEAPVSVHIVLPLEAVPDRAGDEKGAGVVSTILRTPVKNIHLYRLRVLQWNARRGLLVVPLA